MSLLFMRERGMTMTEEQRAELTRWAQSRTLPAGDVFRARLILALAEGRSYRQIMSSLQTTAPTISRWKQRFEQAGSMASMRFIRAVNHASPMLLCTPASHGKRSASQ